MTYSWCGRTMVVTLVQEAGAMVYVVLMAKGQLVAMTEQVVAMEQVVVGTAQVAAEMEKLVGV